MFFVYTVSCVHLYKIGTAVLASLSTALAMPITHLLFMMEMVMGPEDVEPFSVFGVLGLGCVCSGFLLYSTKRSWQKRDVDRDEQLCNEVVLTQ